MRNGYGYNSQFLFSNAFYYQFHRMFLFIFECSCVCSASIRNKQIYKYLHCIRTRLANVYDHDYECSLASFSLSSFDFFFNAGIRLHSLGIHDLLLNCEGLWSEILLDHRHESELLSKICALPNIVVPFQ